MDPLFDRAAQRHHPALTRPPAIEEPESRQNPTNFPRVQATTLPGPRESAVTKEEAPEAFYREFLNDDSFAVPKAGEVDDETEKR